MRVCYSCVPRRVSKVSLIQTFHKVKDKSVATGLEQNTQRHERFITNTTYLPVEKNRNLIDGELKSSIPNYDSIDKELFFVFERRVSRVT